MKRDSAVLIIGEDGGVSRAITTLGLRPVVVGQPREALRRCHELSPSLVLLNLPSSAVESRVLRALSKEGVPVLVLTDSKSSEEIALGNGGNGKIHALARPAHDRDLQAVVRTLLGDPRKTASRKGTPGEGDPSDRYLRKYAPLFLHSGGMRKVQEIIEQVAGTNATVLIRGESGVGKDIVARAIHFASPRHNHPLVKVNCAALPMDLLESELFGHEKGAFTGAYQRKPGKFESANKGTLFLDEIGELPLALQAKLLHVVQDCEFSRVGGRELIRVDVRIIASTNRNLELAMGNGHFREDLYYRLNVVEIQVPPLRERTEEIPALVAAFLSKFDPRRERKLELPPETMRLFTEYPWPGNVRELENAILRLVVLGNVPGIHAEILDRFQALMPKGPERKDMQEISQGATDSEIPLVPLGLREVARRAAQEAERKAIREVLDRVHWNRLEAARLLKVSYKTLLNKINDCGLTPEYKRRLA